MSVLAEIWEDDPSKIIIKDFDWRYKDLIMSVPSASFKKDYFLISKDWPSMLALKYSLHSNLSLSGELKSWVDNHFNEVINPAYKLRSVVASDEGNPIFYPHQRVDIKFLSTARRAILSNDLGSGKSQPLSEPILTPNGWVKMGDIKVGDLVIGSDGNATKVLNVYPQGKRKIFKVYTKDSGFTYADEEHLWTVRSQRDMKTGRNRTMTTKELMGEGLVSKYGLVTSHKFRLPTVSPVNFESVELPIDPYVLGCLLGDGHIPSDKPYNLSISSKDEEILQSFRNCGYELKRRNEGVHDYLIRGEKREELFEDLKKLGLNGSKSDNKFIPAIYKYSSVSDRLALLRGLMDTDGTVGNPVKKKTVAGGTVSYCTVSTALAYDVQEIVRSLGGLATWRYHKRPELGNFDPIVLSIKMPSGMNPFLLPRKAGKVVEPKKYQIARYISKIEYSHEEEAQCIRVEAEDSLYVTRDYIVTHNTFSASGTIRNLHEEGEEVFPLLVVCPNSTKISWSRDFNTAFPGRKITVVDGTATQRRKQFKEFTENDGDVLIMNWDSIRHHSKLLHFGGTSLKRCTECKGLDETIKVTACEAHQKELNEIEFKSVIGDEIHRISDPSTKVSRAFKAASGDADIRIALSGTPINSTPDQLFSALNWLYPKAYPSKVRFIDRFCDTAQGQWGGTTVLGIKKEMEQEFFQGIDPILRRMPKDVILPYLPPVVRVQRDVEMAAKQKKAYEQMKELMVAEYENGEIVRAKSPLSKLLRLSQLASAYGQIELKDVPDPNSPIPGTLRTEEIVTMSDPSAKLDAFIDDLPDYGDSSVVVFAHHKQLIHLLAKRFDKMGIEYGLITGDQDLYERQAYMDSFQNGHIKYILVTLQAGGTGITLTKADTMVFLQRSYSMIDNIQAEGRAHRIGSEQHDKVTIVDYITKGTVDEAVVEAINNKKDNLEFILRDKETITNFFEGSLDEENGQND